MYDRPAFCMYVQCYVWPSMGAFINVVSFFPPTYIETLQCCASLLLSAMDTFITLGRVHNMYTWQCWAGTKQGG